MNNEKINRMKKSFFDGKSSEQEEKFLRENSNDPYFSVMKKERDEKVDWSFEDFLALTATEKEEKKQVFVFKRYAYWSAAAVVLFVLGAYLFTDTSKTPTNFVAVQPTKKQEILTPKNEEPPIPQTIAKMEDNVLPKRIKKHKKETPLPVEDQYNPEYVVINGKPVYNLEEALELTKSSINMLASNVEKSVSNMENVKHLSINF